MAMPERTPSLAAPASVGIDLSAQASTDLLALMPGATVSYSLLDSVGGTFAIDPLTGIVTVANASLLDYETAPVLPNGTDHGYTITVQATTGGVNTAHTFTILVTDAEENVAPNAPQDIDASVNAVDEGAANGTYTGVQAFADDPNTVDTVALALVDSAGGRFSIGPDGKIYVANGAGLDFETHSSWNVTVRATDAAGLFTDSVFAIALNNVAGDTPVDSDGGANSVIEGAANGTYTGLTASLLSPTAAPVTYSLTNDAFGRFQINATTGAVTVADGSRLDFETQSAWDITVRATDGVVTGTQVFTINLTNGNDAPGAISDADGTTNIVNEGATTGTVVGIAAQATDPNGDTLTYSLLKNAGGRFAIDASTGVITVANGVLLDFEAQTAWDITVRATDSGGLYRDRLFTIDVADVAGETPVDSDAATYDAVDENSATGAYTGVTVSSISPSGSAVTYSLVDNAGGHFQIDTVTGAITVLDGSLLDYESQAAWEVTVSASDGTTAHDAVFTIYLNDQVSEAWAGTSGADNFTIHHLGDWVLNGLGGNDVLTATDGQNITFIGGGGNDTLTGRNGNDVFEFSGTTGGMDIVDGGDGYDILRATSANTTIGLTSVANIEEINGNGFSNVMLQLGAGNDTLDSILIALSGISTIRAGAGSDTIVGTGDNETILGEDGNDLIRGGSGADALNGGNGIDTVSYEGSWDAVSVDLTTNLVSGGDATGDTISLFENVIGSDYNDTITGNEFNNTLNFSAATLTNIAGIFGLDGNDTITGSAGADIVIGGAGNDTLSGGNGNDVFRYLGGDEGFDALNGGAGTDTLEAIGYGAVIGLSSITAIETITGLGDTVIQGSAAANTLNFSTVSLAGIACIDGGDGNDNITGSNGDDIIWGGNGADRLTGGNGFDQLTGNLGNDIFDFNAAGESAVGSWADIIADFTKGQDKLDLTTIDANSALAGDQNFSFVGAAAFTGVAGQLRYDASIGDGYTHVFGDVNGDGAADFQIRLSGGYTLAATDFVL